MSKEIGIYIATEQRFWAYRGTIFANAVGGNAFWLRYLDVFSWVRVIARIEQVDSLPETAIPLVDEPIEVVPLPIYHGPAGILRKFNVLWSQTKAVSQDDAAFILRIPGMIGSFLFWHLRARKWPYAVEVVGDPNDSLSRRAIGNNWTHIVRPIAVEGMRRQCWHAAAASYVTRTTLQQLYPTQAEFTTHYSSIELPREVINLPQYCNRSEPKEDNGQSGKMPSLIFVGSLSQRYKGLHVLLQALKICMSQNMMLNLVVLGDGTYRSEYELMAFQLEVDRVVSFRGYVKQGEEVFKNLRQADLFVMPSLVEGLPRALIEAMACGLPCIGSKIGGIPELLSSEDMVPPGDAQALAGAIIAMLNNPERMKMTGQRNREVTTEYHSDVLQSRRRQFYGYVRDITLEHRQRRLR